MKLKSTWQIVLGILLTLTTVASARRTDSSPAVPAGARVQVRIVESLSSGTAKVGDVFHGTLQAPIYVNGRAVYPKGSNVTGKVTAVHRSGRLSDPGVLELVLSSVSYGGASSALVTEPFQIKGESHAKSNVTKIGGGTAAGAIIGALAGGGKGAAIGAGVGAAAGTGVAAATGKKEAAVQSEAVLVWTTVGSGNRAVPQATAYESEPEPEYAHRGRYRDDDDDDRDEPYEHRRDYDDDYRVFSARDRRIIQSCFAGGYSNLPPGLAKRDRLPPGLEKQLRRNGTLPPGLQKRVQPLPGVCLERLPRLPGGWMRVVLSGRVLLLDAHFTIFDMFELGD